MAWLVFVVWLSMSLVCFLCAALVVSCLFCFWCECFVCGVLCCCLLFHWCVVRVCVVVVLFSVLLFCYGLNAFPVCDCICVCPVFALFFSFCVMLCVCLCVCYGLYLMFGYRFHWFVLCALFYYVLVCFCFWRVCVVCGVLCCCLLFHWFLVRVWFVVVGLFSSLFFVMV